MQNPPDITPGFSPSTHTEVKKFLTQCRLPQYYETFISEGFESLESVYEVTEDDMIAMNVKRGHRRVIQREIATARGIPRTQPLVINSLQKPSSVFYPVRDSSIGPSDVGKPMSSSGYGSMSSSANSGSDSSPALMTLSSGREREAAGYPYQRHALHRHEMHDCTSCQNKPTLKSASESAQIGSSTLVDPSADGCSSFSSNDESGSPRSTSLVQTKRKYRRHPKPDKNAPVKPPSAYIMFSNQARAQLKDQNMTFAEIAKAVGDQWKGLSSSQRQMYERTAMQAKDEYLVALDQYRQTAEFKKYQDYLMEFKSKQEVTSRLITKSRRRSRKLESPSSGSVADCSSSNSAGATNGSNGNGSSPGNGGSSSTSSGDNGGSGNGGSASGSGSSGSSGGSGEGGGDGDLETNTQTVNPSLPLPINANPLPRQDTSPFQQMFLARQSSYTNPSDQTNSDSASTSSKTGEDAQRQHGRYTLRPRRTEDAGDKTTKDSSSRRLQDKTSSSQSSDDSSRSNSPRSGCEQSETTGWTSVSENDATAMVVSSDSEPSEKRPARRED